MAEHRPNQISHDERRAATDDEINDAKFDAISEAEEAAALDPRWRELVDAMAAKQENGRISGPPGPELDAQAARWRRALAALRAQCLVTGAGDINKANLVPDEEPPL